jgi:hypothetical protein
VNASEDYPPRGYTVHQAEQWQRMCDEIDMLRADVSHFLTRLGRIETRLTQSDWIVSAELLRILHEWPQP